MDYQSAAEKLRVQAAQWRKLLANERYAEMKPADNDLTTVSHASFAFQNIKLVEDHAKSFIKNKLTDKRLVIDAIDIRQLRKDLPLEGLAYNLAEKSGTLADILERVRVQDTDAEQTARFNTLLESLLEDCGSRLKAIEEAYAQFAEDEEVQT